MQNDQELRDYSPLVDEEQEGVEGEPAASLDHSGSMNDPADSSEPDFSRWDAVLEFFPAVVSRVWRTDAQLADEAGTDEGGLFSSAFNHRLTPLGDVRPDNVHAKLRLVQPDGGTNTVPAYDYHLLAYAEEMSKNPKYKDKDPALWPVLAWALTTDGTASDADELGRRLNAMANGVSVELGSGKIVTLPPGKVRVAAGIIGDGDEHDATAASYQDIARHNKYLRVVTYSGMKPSEIADAQLSLLGVS